MNTPSPQSPQKPIKGYGKHSARYWIILYLVVAIIVYALIYLLFMHKSSGNSGSLNY